MRGLRYTLMLSGIVVGLVVGVAYPTGWPGWGRIVSLLAVGLWVFVGVPVVIGLCEEKAWTGLSLRQQMRSRSDRCVECGYHLRGNESGVCPECGHRWL